MPSQAFESLLPVDPEELFAWHARPGAFERLRPPWQSIEIEEPASLENGRRVQLRLRKGPFRFRWTAEHRGVEWGSGFSDVQTAGPFARWIHHHEFEARDGATVLRDRIDYQLPGGWIGRILAGRQIRRDLETTFAFRHETTSRDLARHRIFSRQPRQRIAVSGTNGLVGGDLVPFLTTGGHEVLRLVRGDSDASGTASWHPEAGLLSPDTAAPLDAVVHLAGENIAGGRWNAGRKERICASRIEGTRNLIASLGRMKSPPKTFVSASAIGYYGSRGAESLDETSPGGRGFLAEVCRDWEKTALEAAELGMRVVLLRFGIILSPAGGALAKMLPAFRLGAGGRLGHGRQFMSWVSIDDTIGAIYQALLDERLSGPVNVVAPEPVSNAEFTRSLGRVLRRPAFVPVPRIGARLLFGEMADEMLFASTRARPRRLEEAGFEFNDRDLECTLSRLLGRVGFACPE